MNTFIFNHEHVDTYYNCSGRTYEEWNTYGNKNVRLALVYIVLGTVYLTILLPFMVAFIKSNLMAQSCYKIMFFLGICDCMAIPISGFYPGYGAVVGMVYCMAPTTNYVIGSLCVGVWGAASSTCMLLAINRCMDMIHHEFAQCLFNGRRVYFWFIIPITYFCYFFFFHSPVIYNSNMYAYFFDPFLGTPERNGTVNDENYPHLGHSIHNISVVVVLVLTYSTLCIYMTIKSRFFSTVKITQMQRQTFILSFLICTGSCIAAPIYVFMQFYPPPVWLVVVGELCWLSSHGAAGISYLLFNKPLRTEVKKILWISGFYETSQKFTTSMHRILGYSTTVTPVRRNMLETTMVPSIHIQAPDI